MSSAAPTRPIFLIGFMGTGKSTVGALVAEETGLPLIDLDQRIEAAAGRSIAAIFASDGEAAFREVEAAVLAEILAGSPAVVATGGGAPCFGDNLERMRCAGLVVTLSATLDSVLARVGDDDSRPLLASPEHAAQLLAAREPVYRQAHACVRTDGRAPAEVASAVVSLARAAERVVSPDCLTDLALVGLAERSYPIVVRHGVLDELGPLTRRALGDGPRRLGLISDSNVGPLYGERAARSLEGAGFEITCTEIPAGEKAKDASHFVRLCEEMVAAGLDRGSAIIALGGGVVGDLAGFVAASLFRGIACVQVPTTVLAMVDSAIGGKTGINIAAGKNLVGAFWQPSAVLADPAVLTTLPARERRAAFGELVKYALLDGEELYAAVDALAPWAARPDEDAGEVPEAVATVARRCAQIKSWIVTRDEREETGERALLNLGHTVGHAIEAATGYQELLHGEAVALGLLAACRLSAALELAPATLETRVAETLARAGLDTAIDRFLTEEVLARIGVDKKRTGSQVRFVTVAGVGAPGLRAIDISEVVRILRGGSAV